MPDESKDRAGPSSSRSGSGQGRPGRPATNRPSGGRPPGGGSSGSRGSSGKPGERRPAQSRPRPKVTSGSSGSDRPRGERPGGDRPASDRPRDTGPLIPEGITGEELDVTVTAELRTLPEELRERVARLLVASAQAIDEDPVQALAFAQAAKKHAARVAVVREAVGLSAYAAGEFALALNELRTVRRLTGSDELVATMADAERGLNRPAKALELLASVNESALTEPTRIEMRLVAAGARADLGQGEAALLTLQIPALTAPYWDEPYVRLRYGYADQLARQGRVEEAATWFERIARQDTEQFTDADARWAELSG